MADDPKAIARRFIEQIVNTGDLDQIPAFVAPALAEATKRHVQGVRSTYPDLVVTVQSQIAEGDVVVTRVTARGTHSGAFRGIPPTNKVVVIEGENIDRIADGKIVEHWGAANTLEALDAIGALLVRAR